MSMIYDLYQEYLYVIGKLKDVYGLHVDVNHKDIHTFYLDKRPLFKLFYGVFSKESEPSIVVSFHLDIRHVEAIQWFRNIYNIFPLLKLHDSFIEDSNGETYLGEDALAIKEVYVTQKIIGDWLENHTREEMEQFSKAKVTGRVRTPNKPFDSQIQREEAIIEFKRIKVPEDGENIH